MKIQATKVFKANWDFLNSDKRFAVNQGSSRSSKTFSILQCLILFSLNSTEKKTISIVRKTLPALKATAMRDFFELLEQYKIYDEKKHNKTQNTYQLNQILFEFFSIDDAQKIRGRKRDICYINEANELFFEDFNQLNLRTTEKIILDFNPSEPRSWVYELASDDQVFIKSTYKDNPFLEKAIIKQIEDLQKTDEEMWKIYGLGERVQTRKNIYANWSFVSEKPETITEYVYGLDFGYNHPTALIKVWFSKEVKEIYIENIIYQSYLTTSDLIALMDKLEVDKSTEILADYARPEIIQELKVAGYYVLNARKEVKKGIDNVKQVIVKCQEDKHLKKEYESYAWKTHNEMILDEPIKLNDDACFVGNTLITTKRGLIPIKDIIPNEDYVLTSQGYRKVLNKFDNGVKPVSRFSLLSDTNIVYLESTNNHLIKTNTEWTEISQLQQEQMVYQHKPSIIEFISYGQIKDIFRDDNQLQCIEKYGKHLMVRNQKDFIFTIKIIILGIIKLIILNWLKLKNIYLNIVKKGLKQIKNGLLIFNQKELKQQKNGIQHQKELNGIAKMENFVGLNDKQQNLNVKYVEKNMNLSLQQEVNTAITIVKLKHLEIGESWNERVYDLEVEEIHEYFANGILVHNCDAIRYAVFYIFDNYYNNEAIISF